MTPAAADSAPPLEASPQALVRIAGRSLIDGYLTLARRRTLACLFAAVLPVAVRVLLLPWFPVPEPIVHDEFSYLLGADTFASGRLTNMPHPFWENFESFHILQQPTYGSKYPPLQAVVLAVGQVLGHPWIGVLLSVAALGWSFCWMLQGWLRPAVALAGALLAGLRFGVLSYWANSYWGGAVAAAGGALVIGAMARLIRHPRKSPGFVLAIGLAILANSRPFEGALIAAPAIAVLMIVSIRGGRVRALIRSMALPFAIVLIPVAIAMGYYNWRVTGDWRVLPYQLHERQYAVASAFLWQQPHPIPNYRHAVMKDLWVGWDLENFRAAREHWATSYLGHLMIGFGFLTASLALAVVMVIVPHPKGNLVDRLTWPVLAVLLVGILPEKSVLPHYIAPAAGLIFLRFMNTAARLWTWRPNRLPLGPLLSMFAFEYVLLQSLLFAPMLKAAAVADFPVNRKQIQLQLEATPGQHLVIVRYGPSHSPHEEWVYNRAGIDSSRIVWAHDMGPERDRALARYFGHRKIWMLDPDQKPLKLVPFEEAKP